MEKLIFIGWLTYSFFASSQEEAPQINLPMVETYYEQVGPRCDTNKCGRWLTYYPNGEVAMVETFDDLGFLKGERVTFRMDGTIKHYTEWKKGIKVGKEILFDEKGYPTEVIYHK
jgi:antitoxin component YwqK of YwqJK toxin-antitoxin module